MCFSPKGTFLMDQVSNNIAWNLFNYFYTWTACYAWCRGASSKSRHWYV